MATSAPSNFDVNFLRSQVIATYDRVVHEPDAGYHFHRGPDYAQDFLGYDRDELAALPALATQRFAGVGNPLAIGAVPPGRPCSTMPAVPAWICCWRPAGSGPVGARSAST